MVEAHARRRRLFNQRSIASVGPVLEPLPDSARGMTSTTHDAVNPSLPILRSTGEGTPGPKLAGVGHSRNEMVAVVRRPSGAKLENSRDPRRLNCVSSVTSRPGQPQRRALRRSRPTALRRRRCRHSVSMLEPGWNITVWPFTSQRHVVRQAVVSVTSTLATTLFHRMVASLGTSAWIAAFAKVARQAGHWRDRPALRRCRASACFPLAPGHPR